MIVLDMAIIFNTRIIGWQQEEGEKVFALVILPNTTKGKREAADKNESVEAQSLFHDIQLHNCD